LVLAPGVTGLLGANGSGKSTFIKLACGLLSPSLGKVKVFGRPPASRGAVRARIGLVPEIDQFYEDMTAHGFVAAMLRLSGLPRRDAAEQAEQSLRQMGMAEALNRRIRGFSKGMRQRTKLAQALAHDPDLLLMDEPLNGLDPLGRKAVIELVRRLGAAGKTVLVSSHVLHEVEAMTPNIALIHQGRLLAQGSVREIRELMDDRPSRFRIRCDEPRRLAAALLERDTISGITIGAAEVELATGHRSRCLQHLGEIASSNDLVILGLESLDESLEAVFDYLVRR
jgi:ABC-2 type transport system ATP-binding protein